MSLNATLNTALTGLQVNQSLMRVTSSNIANASTEGYTRKVGEVGSIVLNDIGGGVRIEDVRRKVDNYLIRQVNGQTSTVATSDALSEFYTRLQDLFGTPEANTSIAGILTTLRTSLEQLALDANQSVAQFTAVTNAVDVADEFHSLSTQIQAMREEVDRQIKEGVDKINLRLVELDRLNTDIVRNTVLGAPVGELLDKRDVALKDIAGQMDIKWFERTDGSTHVMTGSNYMLLDSQPRTLSFTSPAGVTKATVYPGGFQPIEIGDVVDDITTEVEAGRINALIDLRDTVLPGLQDQLDLLAANFADEMNRAHNSAMPVPGLKQFTGLNEFDSSVLLDAGNPESIPLVAYDNGTTTAYGTIQFAIIDDSGNAVGDALRVNLDEFKAEMEAYVSAATGGPFTYDLTVGDIINMLNGAYAATPPPSIPVPATPAGWPGAAVWPPSPALVMPSSGSDIAGLYNLSGASISGAFTNGAFARVVNGTLEIGLPSASPYGLAIDDKDTTFTQTGSTRAATFNYLFGLNNLYVIDPAAASAAADIQVRDDIEANPIRVGRGYLASVLRDPTDATTEEWYVGRGDGAGATAMANVFEAQIDFATAGILPQSSQRLTEYAASIIQANARGSSDAKLDYDFQSSLLTELESRQGQVSGVNIDEELAGLVSIQNAYAASARVVTTVNSMYDDLMLLVG
jgi:flagellar hook-associated protein 1 FlgK